jgi:ABC-type transport system involved in cytochrome c biogenesis permease component
LICTGLFVGGTWLLVKALGTAMSGKNPVQVALLFVIGLGLKFPAVIFCLEIVKMKRGDDVRGAIVGIVLVYFTTVAFAMVTSHRREDR